MGNLNINLRWLFIIALVPFLFVGCDIDRSGLKPSTGKTNELLVVTNSEALWKGRVGQEISEFFGQYQAGLPQPEKTFDVAHIPDPNFSQMFKTHHNIFILDIDPSFNKPVIETHTDFWAKPQRVVKMTVADEQTFFTEFELYKASFMELFNANERKRAAQAFGTIEDFNIKNQLINKYDINIMIPKSFYVANEKDEFVWLRREAQQFSQGILIYFYPYTDTIAFDPDRIISIRDGFTSKYVPGPADGSFMKTSMMEPPVSRQIDFNGHFAIETRGLWELEGDFMGGPFISYTLVDPRYNRVVTMEGFVYNPNQDKKNLLRQLEALLYTLDFPDETVSEDVN
jgi:hypothetical protein